MKQTTYLACEVLKGLLDELPLLEGPFRQDTNQDIILDSEYSERIPAGDVR